MVQLRIISDEGSNRLGYERPFGEFIDLTIKLQNCPTNNRLFVINNALLETRQRARDESNGEIKYKGAAVIRTEMGHWFAMPNIVVHDDPMQRDSCAERGVVKEGRFHEMDGFKIAELWYTGGRANKRSGLELDMHEYDIAGKKYRFAKPNTPCGSCRDIILKYGSENTIVHMVPMNDGIIDGIAIPLLTGDPEDKRKMEELEPNRVFSRKISELLPHVYAYLADAQGLQKTMLRTAYNWIKDSRTWQAIKDSTQHQQIRNLAKMEKRTSPEQQLQVINKLLMKTAKQYYQDTKTKPKFLSIAIVRDAKGNYYMGKHIDNGVLPATTASAVDALHQMSDTHPEHRFTDVFIVSFDNQENEAVTAYNTQQTDDIAIKMPNGAVREILKKFAPQNGDIASVYDLHKTSLGQSSGNIHVFLPNNPDSRDFDPKCHVISMTIKELLPYAWQNPKSFPTAERQH